MTLTAAQIKAMLDASCSHHGGYLHEVPEPHIRMCSLPGYRRVVVVKNLKFIAGGHYYVSITEEDDPVWDAKQQGWRYAWDDEKKRGRSFDARYSHIRFVQPWIDRTIAQHFSPKDRYAFEYDSIGTPTYGRDGD